MISQEAIKWAVLESLSRMDQRREDLGLSVRELAKRSGLHPVAVQRMLRTATSHRVGQIVTNWDIRSSTRLALELALGMEPGDSNPSREEIEQHAGIAPRK